MPLPTPNSGETQDEFIERCMSDDTMVEDFPDEDQRLPVCSQQWAETESKSRGTGPIVCRRDVALELADIRLEKRAGKPTKIVGYGAVFYDGTPGTEFQLWPGVLERIAPTAFDRALEERDDVRGLFNHQPDNLLGRTSAGTMKLTVDPKGLRYEIEPGDTTVARDVIQHIERGDLSGSSFMFGVEKQSFETLDDGTEIRTIESVKPLYDTGPVTFPAYDGSTTGVRDRELEAARRSIEAWKIEKKMPYKPRTDEDLEEHCRWLELKREKKSRYDN